MYKGEIGKRNMDVLDSVNPVWETPQLFHAKVEEELRRNGIQSELVITQHQNHAKSIVESRKDVDEFNAIIIMSGDGLVFEILNGLFNRNDRWEILHTLPIGIIPSGSGNGLLSSIFHSRGYSLKKKDFVEKAIELSTSKNSRAQPVTLLHAQTKNENFVAFLSLGWGLMADIDIESERWRKPLGSNRFVVGALLRCLNLRSYKGRLSFKVHHSFQPKTQEYATFPVFGKTAAEKIRECTCRRPHSTQTNEGPGRRNEDVWMTSHSVEGIPSIDEPIDDSWDTVEDDFIGVYAVALSHISNTGPMQPSAKLDDDIIHLSYIRKRDVPSRMSLIKMLSALEEGKHLKIDFLKWVQVSSFRLEKLTCSKGRIVLDGEEVDTLAIQVTSSVYTTSIISDAS